METLNAVCVQNFFSKICAEFPVKPNTVSVIITHLLPDRPFLLDALSKQTHIALVLAKPKSVHQATKNWLSKRYPVDVLRKRFSDASKVTTLLKDKANSKPLVLLNIGGYFANIVDYIHNNYDGGLLGVIEDTENGHQQYQKQSILACPVISVARSPLKNPEDYLVGQSIVYSTEALLREQGDVLHGRTACVIGYGKLGRSIAHLLHARHVRTVIYDINAIKIVEAMSHGFAVSNSLEKALSGAGLIFCATGNISLQRQGFQSLKVGAYIATVTSSDDELKIDDICDYKRKQVTDYITKYQKGNHYFFLLNRGQAVNFIHGAAVGPFIYLIQAEILASISRVSQDKVDAGINENDSGLRKKIANIWLEHFCPTIL